MDLYSLVDKVLAKDEHGIDNVISVLMKAMDYIHSKDIVEYDKLVCCLESKAYAISPDEAKAIVQRMSPMGQQWNWSQISDYIKSKNIPEADTVHWYLVMNMVYNDYFNTAKAFGHLGDVEFFYNLSKDFIDDPDAKPLKIEKYFV